MGKEYTAKSFKSGNSVAIRMPATLGVEPDREWTVVQEEEGKLVLRAKDRPKRKFNIDKVWGCAIGSGLQFIKDEDRVFEERPLLWDDPEWRAKHMPKNMKFMLDSNVVIAVALADGAEVRRRMAEHDEGDFVMSAVAYAEVVHGSERGKQPLLDRLHTLIEEVPVLPFDQRAAAAYAKIPFRRGSYDRLIAAHALSLGSTVITFNERHFVEVPGLMVENWAG